MEGARDDPYCDRGPASLGWGCSVPEKSGHTRPGGYVEAVEQDAPGALTGQENPDDRGRWPEGMGVPGTPQGPHVGQGASGPPPPPAAPQPGFIQPPFGQPGYAQQSYGQPPTARIHTASRHTARIHTASRHTASRHTASRRTVTTIRPNPYGQPGYGYGHTAQTNGFAIASLCCSIGAVLLIGVPALLGVIFGFVGRSQIARSNGTQKGGGLALAGIIIGLAVLAFWILIFVAIAVAHPECSTPGGRC